jgi:hypothetical protein
MNKTNEQQLLRNPEIQPTSEIIADGLGTAYKTYTKFMQELEHYKITLMDWRFYNDGKAWLSKGEYKWTTQRGANKVKPIFWLSIWRGFFRVSFFFSSDIQEELLQLSISQNAKELIRDASPMGKTMRFLPIVFDISNETQLSDLYILSEFRKIRVK